MTAGLQSLRVEGAYQAGEGEDGRVGDGGEKRRRAHTREIDELPPTTSPQQQHSQPTEQISMNVHPSIRFQIMSK